MKQIFASRPSIYSEYNKLSHQNCECFCDIKTTFYMVLLILQNTKCTLQFLSYCICTASTPLLMSVRRGLFGKSAFGVDVVVFCVSQTRKKICPLGAACAQLSRPCMKRICHGADARACVYVQCALLHYIWDAACSGGQRNFHSRRLHRAPLHGPALRHVSLSLSSNVN